MCFYQLQDHCARTHVQLLHHQDQSSWSRTWPQQWISNSSSRSRSKQSHFHQTSNTIQAMYAFHVCADEEDFIVSKSFTSDRRFSKRPQAWLIVGWIEMQPELIPINQKPPWCPMNPKRPRPGPIETMMIQIALCECLIGNGRRYLHGIAQFSLSFIPIFLQEYPCIVGLVCNECNALNICCLRPTELEYHKQQEVLPH